ncbi:LOW QUALITY PROTEIN: uncharacterized protein LOC117315101 [Pecten maximus]|uniref:LOW QUALITY PROTEIN: uncharacterized protein LOC117315101 n=1 Tax=Pecten maximus TaxID=6579 RepID=UPI001458AB30|nr:LOW QUALITY PROTEIN: uncharacterized protein LOC117315101 [Pecten maximus]
MYPALSSNGSKLMSQSCDKLKEPGGFLDQTSNLTLSLFIDGIPLFTSSAVSLWPVYLLINEIPPKERFRKKNMLPWGVWQGTGKPKMNMFLRPLVMDLLNMYTNGVTFHIVSHELEVTEIKTKAMLIIVTMDLQARAHVCAMTQHTGLNGCLYCMEPGEVVPSGKAHCRAYPSRDQPPVIRTDEVARASAVVARETSSRTQGFLRESVLWYLPYFSLTTNVGIDYKHGILLGVTKRMLSFWFNSKYSSKPYFIGSKVTDIDKILRNIKPPYMIHRLPRTLSNNYHHWKASELRNWLLFYSLPCLNGHLPQIYNTHFSCLVEGTYLLLTEGISSDDLTRADALLRTFVSNIQRLYGKECMSLNVHNLTHLMPFVKLWGPLWVWSCFPYESFNGEIKRSIHDTGNVCKQIIWSLQAQKRIESSLRSRKFDSSNEVNCFLQDMLDTRSERFSADSEAFQCSIIKSSTSSLALTPEDLNNQKSLVGTNKKEDFINVTKIARNGFQMYCKSLCKMKKQNSYTIKLEKLLKTNDGKDADAVEVESYVMEKKTRKVFAFGKLLISSGSILPGRVPFLQKLEFDGNERVVIPAETLRERMMIVPVKTSLFGAILPNNVERD